MRSLLACACLTGLTLAPPTVPVGTQFGPPADLPVGAGVPTRIGTSWFAVGSTPDPAIKICPKGTRGTCTTFATDLALFTGDPGPTMTATVIDKVGTVPSPKGFPVRTHLVGTNIVKGPAGFVIGANLALHESLLFHRTSRRAMIEFSPDGHQWQRIDLRPVLGDTLAELGGVSVAGDRYYATGATAKGPKDTPSGFVLSSPDGVTWTKVAEPRGTWATSISRVERFGSELLAIGGEYGCDTSPGFMLDFSIGWRTLVWRSADGAAWAPLDLAAIAGASVPAVPTPCPSFQDRAALGFAPELTVGEREVVLATSDGATITVHTSGDLATWKTASIPLGANPGAAASTLVTIDAQGIHVLVLAPVRSGGVGWRVRSWSSVDAGASFVADAQTAPFVVAEKYAHLVAQGDGSVLLVSEDTSATHQSVALSVAGPLAAPACELAAHGRCQFGTLPADKSLAGKDLSGISLAGTILSGADLSGVKLVGADLRGASGTGVNLSNADLSNANLTALTLIGTPDAPVVLRGANLAGANLSGALLSGVDLTGATLAGAAFDGGRGRVLFAAGTICPDGKAADATAGGAAACRLGG